MVPSPLCTFGVPPYFGCPYSTPSCCPWSSCVPGNVLAPFNLNPIHIVTMDVDGVWKLWALSSNKYLWLSYEWMNSVPMISTASGTYGLALDNWISPALLQPDDEESPGPGKVLSPSVWGIPLKYLRCFTNIFAGADTCFLWLFTVKHCSLHPEPTEFWYSCYGCLISFFVLAFTHVVTVKSLSPPWPTLCINPIAPIL